MFLANVREPVLPSVGALIFGRHSGGCKPVRTLPAQLGAKTRALRFERVVERRGQIWATAFVLLVRPTERVVLAVEFKGAVPDPCFVLMHRAETPQVHHP